MISKDRPAKTLRSLNLNTRAEELTEAQRRTIQWVEELAEAQSRTVQWVEVLAESLKRTEGRLGLIDGRLFERGHVANIYSKLQVADRAQAAIRARDAGLGSKISVDKPHNDQDR